MTHVTWLLFLLAELKSNYSGPSLKSSLKGHSLERTPLYKHTIKDTHFWQHLSTMIVNHVLPRIMPRLKYLRQLLAQVLLLSGYMNDVCGYLFLPFKDCREIRQINTSYTLMNLQYQDMTMQGSAGGSRKKKIEAVLSCLVSAVEWLVAQQELNYNMTLS